MTGAAAAFVVSSAGISLNFSGITVSGYSNTGAAANIATGSVIVTPSGGIAPYTYAWTQYGTSPYTWAIGSAATATTNFTCNAVPAGVSTSVQFLITVTDSAGNMAHGLVTATVNNGQPYNAGDGIPQHIGGQIP